MGGEVHAQSIRETPEQQCDKESSCHEKNVEIQKKLETGGPGSPQAGSSKDLFPIAKKKGSNKTARRNSNSDCSNVSDNEDSTSVSSPSEDSSSSESEKPNTETNAKKGIRKPNPSNTLRKACEHLIGLLKRRREQEKAANKT